MLPGVLVFCGISFMVGLSFIVESARENIEHDKPCESYQTLKWTSHFSKESKYLLGSLYSLGVCSAQDIPQAKELYASVFGDDSARVAQALFHDAIQLSDFYERGQKEPNTENIHALLLESKRLGFQPSVGELGNLTARGLKEMFTDSARREKLEEN